ncbi:MAG: carbon storage regulator [Rhodospirillales bacterium]|jgi:carbon storage regulator|nr:carbon storage regulator [Rhodospirillales bacterium]
MLVLTRKRGQRILIGESITVELLDWDGSQARVGIDAPIEIPIRREELPDLDRRDAALQLFREADHA